MNKINKTSNEVKPYTYLLKFNVGNQIKYYYGVRTANVRQKLTPGEDLFVKYFTSSRQVKKILNDNILPFEIIIHKSFNSKKEACDYEIKFLQRINAKHRADFLNLTDSVNVHSFSVCNIGRVYSIEEKKKISTKSSVRQSSIEYRKKKSEMMKEKWTDPEFRTYILDGVEKFKNSEKFIAHRLKKSKAHIGLKESEITKLKKSISAKNALKDVDMKLRMSIRQRYICPFCTDDRYQNLLGHNFNRHMERTHNWNLEESKQFKENYSKDIPSKE